MQIEDVVIERRDGPFYCGILLYRHPAAADPEDLPGDLHDLPWTMNLEDPRQVVLKLFPAEVNKALGVVQDHYEEMADAIVDRVMAPPGR